jgi:hypothetical protein
MTRLGKLLLSLVLLIGALSIHPRIASANCSACLHGTPHTVNCWSKAASCAAALSNLTSVCLAQATSDGNCGSLGNACEFSATWQSACYWNGSEYQIDATGTHGCVYCGQ